MSMSDFIPAWSVLRQIGTKDRLGLGKAAQSSLQANLRPRTAQADEVVKSNCPYCAVGCGQNVYVKDGEITQIEGDPDSPIREYKVKYRRPYGAEWEELDLDRAMDMIADRVINTRNETWEDTMETQDGGEAKLHRTQGIAHLGGATLDNEENYLMKKFYTAMGIVQVENQARI